MSSVNGRPDILTRSGQYFDFMEPDKYDLKLEDIAHGLSQCCRFVGQCSTFYSVAQHSVYTSHIVDPEFAWAALFHDAAEAFLGDVSRPLKALLPDYRAIEKRVEQSLFKKLRIPYPLPQAIKVADAQMLHLEQKALMPPHADLWGCDVYPLPPGIILNDSTTLSPPEAFDAFMERCYELQGD